MNKLLLIALVAIGFLVSARADIQVVVSIRNQTTVIPQGAKMALGMLN